MSQALLYAGCDLEVLRLHVLQMKCMYVVNLFYDISTYTTTNNILASIPPSLPPLFVPLLFILFLRLPTVPQVVNVHINSDGMHSLVSGSRVGDLLWWDQRFPGQPIRSVMVSSVLLDSSSLISASAFFFLFLYCSFDSVDKLYSSLSLPTHTHTLSYLS